MTEGLPIENEVGILPRLFRIEPTVVVKEVLAEALAVDRKEELLRDDLVGVDVRAGERRGDGGERREFFHD